jgi:hypothetical protein
MTFPGFWRMLELGLPPGKTQEYPAIVPSGSVPLPEKSTPCPTLIVTSEVGLVIVPDGG